MQYIINSNNTVIAIHEENQNIAGLYPDCRSATSAEQYELFSTIPDGEITETQTALSKLKIVDLLIALNTDENKLLDSVMNSISANPVTALRWSVANEIMTGDPMVMSIMTQLAPLMKSLGLTMDQVIAKCQI